MDKFKSLLQVIIAISVCVSMTLGAMHYFAKASDLQELRSDYEYSEIQARIWRLQDRIWDLESRYSANTPMHVQEELKRLKQEKFELEKQADRRKLQ